MKYDEESIILEEDDGFQLVDPQRDFVPGSVLLRNVADAISRSRRMIMLLSRLLLPSATYLRQGNVFTSVCHSVHRGCLGGHPPGRHLPGQTAPWADPQGRHPIGQTTPWADTSSWADTPCPADGYCSGWYASYWNAFLFDVNPSRSRYNVFNSTQFYSGKWPK